MLSGKLAANTVRHMVKAGHRSRRLATLIHGTQEHDEPTPFGPQLTHMCPRSCLFRVSALVCVTKVFCVLDKKYVQCKKHFETTCAPRARKSHKRMDPSLKNHGDDIDTLIVIFWKGSQLMDVRGRREKCITFWIHTERSDATPQMVTGCNKY